MVTPYVYTIEKSHVIEGDKDSATVKGTQAFFAAEVPFIPSFMSDDFTRVSGGTGRIGLVLSRQIRFINDLTSIRGAGSVNSGEAETYNLRYIATPQPGQPHCNIRIVFIGKVFCPAPSDHKKAEKHALRLWRKFYSHFPLEDPFNYPLIPVTVESLEKNNEQKTGLGKQFEQCYLRPFPCDQIGLGNLVEIRKYEDRDPQIRRPDSISSYGYYPHPFRPALDFSAMGRFMETLAYQEQHCVVSISLQPTALSREELKRIVRIMSPYSAFLNNKRAQELMRGGSPQESEGKADQDSVAQESKAPDEWLILYRQEYAERLWKAYKPLIDQQAHLFSFLIQVVGEGEAPSDVIEALGSELMDNTTQEPRLWTQASPTTSSELDIARDNLAFLEQRIWGESNIRKPRRLPFLASADEAAGAFRLPIPPESGYLPGIPVRDEPFVLPPELLAGRFRTNSRDTNINLGRVRHRGTLTEIEYTFSVSDLKRHALVTGSTGSGKTTTCLHILKQLKSQHKIPFLVIYPIDRPDYRFLMEDEDIKRDLLIFTVGDQTTVPFRFNPFVVPPGILLKTHMSHLMRCFMAAFFMWDPLPAIYRAALRKVYVDKGWRDIENAKGVRDPKAFPVIGDFYKAIVEVASQLTQEYGDEVKGDIRGGSEIRIHDLLRSVGHVLNVHEDGSLWQEILNRPTVMELGRVGSTEDSALIMGFLLTSLSAELVSRQKEVNNLLGRDGQGGRPFQHFTLVEEAHRLMAAPIGSRNEYLADSRTQGGEDFSNILAEVRGYGEGILIAEQIPTTLVAGAIGNTYVKIMHWQEDKDSFDLFCDIMNLNNQQRNYSRTLQAGQAIVRSKTGRPVLVDVTDYIQQFRDADGELRVDTTDDQVKQFMENRIWIPGCEPFELAGTVENPGAWGESCRLCNAKCLYANEIESLPYDTIAKFAGQLSEAMKDPIQWSILSDIGQSLFPADPRQKEKLYCCIAYFVSGLEKKKRHRYQQGLEQFEENYNER